MRTRFGFALGLACAAVAIHVIATPGPVSADVRIGLYTDAAGYTCEFSGTPGVVDGYVVFGAALAAKSQYHLAPAGELRMAIPQGSEAEAAVGSRVLLVAHADLGGVEELHHQREHLFPWQAVEAQVATHGCPQPAQRLSKAQHA